MSPKDADQTLDLPWRFSPRLLTNHLGALKYNSSSRAFGELVANSLDAKATRVRIVFRANPLERIDRAEIIDNGRGISLEDVKTRFVFVGVEPSGDPTGRLGHLGVGRLAVHRIGPKSEWTSVSKARDGRKQRLTFQLDAE